MGERRKARWLRRLLALVLLGGATALGSWLYREHGGQDEPRYMTSPVGRGDLQQGVMASGQLNPVVMVEVGSQISGNIEKLLADFNSTVKAGQLIAQIDAGTYEAAFIQAEGNLANAKAALELAQITEARTKTLRADKLNAQAEYDNALAGLHQAEASVKINEGGLKKAQVDLSRCKIYAPIDGVVISRNVSVGQTVAASLSAPTLFVIANDLSRMHIEASVAEADIGLVSVGQSVDFTVDALPGRIAQGKVAQIRYAPNTNQNVITYDVIVEVTNPDLKLLPGMTANVSIIVSQRDNVLKIPNAALRFRPSKGADGRKPGLADAGMNGAAKSEAVKPKKDNRKPERTLYVLRGAAVQPVKAKLGITDGRETELIEGLKEGDAVVVDMIEPKESGATMSRLFSAVKK